MNLLAHYANEIGLFGVGLILVAYFLIQLEKITADHLSYSVLNFIGSGLMLYSLIYHWNLASAIFQIIWMLICLIGVVRYFRTKSRVQNI